MKSKKLILIVAALLSVAFTTTLHAQTSAFTYQGRLTDTSGPANGTYDLQFTIYDADTGGSVVAGPITNSLVAVTNGLFTTTLDFGAGVFDGGNRWLEIGVATNGSDVFTNLSPRQQITSTPYAIQAANAANAVNAGSVAAANITGTIATTQLPTSVVTNGTSGVSLAGTFSGDGSGLTNVPGDNLGNHIATQNIDLNGHYLSGNGASNGVFVAGNGNVGLGTASPQARLDVSDNDVNSGLRITPTALGPTITYKAYQGGTKDLRFIFQDQYGTNTEVMRIKGNSNTGWVGIGVTNPATALDVNGTVTATAFVGDGSGLTGLSATNLAGTVGLAQLPTTVLVTNGASGVSISGTFSGDGTGVTNVNLLYANTQGAITFGTNYGSFMLASTLAAGNGVRSVTAADVNGDGHQDLISANVGTNTLTVLTNDGSGRFVLSSSPVVGSGPQSVTAADVNGDGHPDLISANGNDNTLTVLTNDGSGGFVLSSSPAVGPYPSSVTAADVNADGHPDLIFAHFYGNTLSVWTNNGSGGFVLASSPLVGNWPDSVTATDVNGDGHPDLICANEIDNTLTVLTNDGSGGFVTASTLSVGSAPDSVTAADVNGDGHPDLICADGGTAKLTVLTNDGSGVFVTASTLSVGTGPDSVTAADVNGDGHPDLICANAGSAADFGNTLTVLTNDGSGGFALASAPGVGTYPQSVAVADVNGDGRPDLISANTADNTLTVLFNVPAAALTGNGSGLTGLNATNLTGTVGLSNLPSALVKNNETGVTLNGTFTGDGSGLTGLNAANLTGSVPAASLTSVPAASLTGTVPLARLPASVVTNGASGLNLSGTLDVTAAAGSPVFQAGNPYGSFQVTCNPPFIGTTLVATFNGASNLAPQIRFSADGFAKYMDIGQNTNGDFVVEGSDSPRLVVENGGNVGIGVTDPATALDVNGTATVNAIAFPDGSVQTNAYPATGIYTVSAGDFISDPSTLAVETAAPGGTFIANPTSNQPLLAPVHLPQGAKVTRVTFYVYDTDTNTDLLTLLAAKSFYGSIQPLVQETNTTSSGEYSAVVQPTGNITVNNSQYSYLVYVRPLTGTWPATGGQLAVNAVVINYTRP